MQPNTVSPEILYNLILDFKNDANRRFDEHSGILREHSNALKELQAGQAKVQIRFTSSMFLFNAFVTFIISALIGLFLN